jgi:serine/threonine-protein kinase
MDIAPDGSAIVFTHGRGEATQLFLKRRDEVTSTVIPGTSGQPTAPTFSPDGQWLAYAGGRDRKLYTIPRAGGSPTALADSLRAANTSMAWLETDTLLYVHQDNGLRAVSSNGGPSRIILAADTGGRLARNVSALPGGRSALFMMCERGCRGSALLAVDLRTNNTKRLAEDALDAWWLPGGVVAYAARDGQVYAAPFDVKTLSFTRTPVAVLTGVRGTPGNADMVVSASGMALYVPGNGMLSVSSDAMPVWVSRSGTATPVDTGWRVGLANENGRTLALSPDGKQLAFMERRSGVVEADIWVRQLDRASFTNTRVTFGGNNADPVWSPDGRSLLFTSGSSGRLGFVFRKPADGTGVMDTVVRLARGLNEVVVTPESTTFLVRLIGPGSRDIVQAQRGRDTAVPLVASPTYSEIAPALSPDGKWLAYASNESGRYEVYVRPFPDVNAGRWQLSQAGGLTPLWSRNGRELFYLDGAGMLVSAAVLPGATFKLGTQTPLFNTNGYASNEISLFYDVSPDAQRFLLLRLPVSAATGGKVELVQITNWAAEVRAKLAGAVR